MAKTAVFLAVFCTAGINATALLAGTPPPPWTAYGVAWAATFVVFFQMRVCDEHKDHAADTQYRPERPVPRGLISLVELRWLGGLGVPVAAGLTAAIDPTLLYLLAAVWIWLALMTVEFFVPAWLKARPVPYLVSHMVILPLLTLLVTGLAWARTGEVPDGVGLLLLLSFANGIVLEIGRKLYAPDNERDGVETYSSLWGGKPAAGVWLITVLTAAALTFTIGVSLRAEAVIGPAVLLGLLLAFFAALDFSEALNDASQRRIDRVAGLWVLLTYAGLAAAPLVAP